MIKIFKRLIAWLLEKIASKIEVPPKPEGGYFNKNGNEETLQEAVKAVLTRTVESLRADPQKQSPDSSETDEDNSEISDKADNEGKDSLSKRIVVKSQGITERIKTLPRWVKLITITSLPICILYIFLYLLLVSPPDTNPEDIFRYNQGKPLIRIGYVKEWQTSEIITSLIAEAMDMTLNVDISTKPVSQNHLPDLWNLLVTDRADLTPSVWLPKTHIGFIIDAENTIVDLNTWLKGARLGLAVPAYMPIKSIEDLKNYQGKKIIYGIDPYSKLHNMTEQAIELYGIKGFRIIAKSDKFMLKRLEEALSKKEDIIIAIWTPHWIFGEWEVKMLSDPLKVFGNPEDIHIVTSEKFYASFPDICRFLSKIKLTPQELSKLMASARKTNSPGTAANKWLQTNKDKVMQWIAESEAEE